MSIVAAIKVRRGREGRNHVVTCISDIYYIAMLLCIQHYRSGFIYCCSPSTSGDVVGCYRDSSDWNQSTSQVVSWIAFLPTTSANLTASSAADDSIDEGNVNSETINVELLSC